MGRLENLLKGARYRFKMSRATASEARKMEKAMFEELYEKYKDQIEEIYAKGKAAVDDGFDFKDLEVLKDIFVELKEILDSFQEELSLEDKKDFAVFLIMKIYDKYYEKLPWWARLIPFKTYFVQKYVKKYIGKLFDYLHEKGIVDKTGM